MAIKSVYCPNPQIEDSVVSVSDQEHRHLKVSRTAVGEKVEIFDGRGHVWPGKVLEIRRNGTRVQLGPVWTADAPKVQIILAQALVRNPAFEWILEKAVEVGVTRIIPFRAARSNETGQGRERRWQRILIEAAKQSKQYWLPQLDATTDMAGAIAAEASSKILFAEHGGGSLKSALSGEPVLYLIGPEGGWTRSELEAADRATVGQVHLGSQIQIMRAETAAIVAAGLIAYELGALSHEP